MKQNFSSSVVSLPRALSKLGYCSRSKALELIHQGKVKVNSVICFDAKRRVNLLSDNIEVNGEKIQRRGFVYIMLNKPRGLTVTTKDEKGRDTVYSCFKGEKFPYIFPVGRLDKASEGLLLFTNDTRWANGILDPTSKVEKVYHVKLRKILDEQTIYKIKNGIKDEKGEILDVKAIRIIRTGKVHCWVEIVLDKGKNRHIRRIFKALGIEVLRLVRISVGNLKLGNLPKGKFRFLTEDEIKSLRVYEKLN